MSNLIPLADLSSDLWKKVRKQWFKEDESMEDTRREDDPLAERPESWYKGPLIFSEILEEGFKEAEEVYATSRQYEVPHDSEGR